MKLLLFITAVFILITQSSCKEKKVQVQEKQAVVKDTSFFKKDFEVTFFSNPENAEVLEQNAYAVELMNKRYLSFNPREKDSLLNESESVLIKIIEEKKDFYKAYINLATVYIKKKNYIGAELILERLLNIIEYPEAYFYLGILLEKQHKIKAATEKYKRALFFYNEYLTTYMSSFNDEINREYIILLLEGKGKSLKRLDEYIKNNPGVSPPLERDFILNFNREKFINDF